MNPTSNMSNQQIDTKFLQNNHLLLNATMQNNKQTIENIPGYIALKNTPMPNNLILAPNNSMLTMNTSIPPNSMPIINVSISNESLPIIKADIETIEETMRNRYEKPILKTNTEEDQIINILNDFIKNNNLSQEEQKDFYDELKKINKNLPLDKKVIISFEKNIFKFQVLDIPDKNLSKNTAQVPPLISPIPSSLQNPSLNIKMYNFDKNMRYISLSSIILTFLIIILLVLKWNESQ